MLVRNAILRIFQSKALASLVRQMGGRSGLVRRFVAGETVKEALSAVRGAKKVCLKFFVTFESSLERRS